MISTCRPTSLIINQSLSLTWWRDIVFINDIIYKLICFLLSTKVTHFHCVVYLLMALLYVEILGNEFST